MIDVWLNIFNISHYNTFTLSHQFLSEITLHTAKIPKSYFLKNRLFLGDFGVVYNYIVYIIFFSSDIPFDSFFYVKV